MVGGECPGTRLRGSSPLPPQMRVRSGDSPSLLSTILLCPRTKEKLVQSAGQGGRLLKWGHQQSERWLEAWFEDGVGRAKEGGAGTVCGAGPASSRGLGGLGTQEDQGPESRPTPSTLCLAWSKLPLRNIS